MNKKLSMLAVAVSMTALCNAGSFDVNIPVNKISGYLDEILKETGPIYNQNWQKALELYNYATTNKTFDVHYVVEKASELINSILSNDKMRQILFALYKTDIDELARVLMLGNAITIPPLAINFAKTTLGYDNATAMQFSNALVDLAEWMQELYRSIYIVHLKNKLDDIFAKRDVKDISIKLNELLTQPDVREVVLKGLLYLKKHWAFIVDRLRTYGLDPVTAESIVNKLYATVRAIEEKWMPTMPVELKPLHDIPVIPGIEW